MRKIPLLILLIVAVSTVWSGPAFAETSIGEAKSLPDGTEVTLTGKVVTSSYGEISNRIYIQEPGRSAGIQAYIAASYYPSILEGETVTVSGKMATLGMYERAISSVIFNSIGGTQTTVPPVAMKIRDIGGGPQGLQRGVLNGLGLGNIGLLVRTTGWIRSIGPNNVYAVMDDGSGATLRMDLFRVNPKPIVDYYVTATGIVSTSFSGTDLIPYLRPRRTSDVIPDTSKLDQEIKTTRIPDGKLGIFWLGQAGYVFKDSSGHEIVIDPYLSNYCYSTDPIWVRLVPVPLAPEWLKPGLTLLTHDHGDHTDPWTLKAMWPNCQSVFWGPTSCCDHMAAADIGVPADRRTAINRGQTLTWDGIQITAVYANHTVDSVGYVINIAGRKVYISGDTSYDSTLLSTAAAQKPDIAIVCINGAYGNMTASEAASVVKASGAKTAIPMHYGMFACNTVDPQTFVTACSDQGVTAQVIVLPTFGHVVL